MDRLTALARLDANWCTKLPDRAVESIVGSCLALEHLGLKGCSALVSPSIQSAKLRSLDLSLCGKLVRERGTHAQREREGEKEGGGEVEGRRKREKTFCSEDVVSLRPTFVLACRAFCLCLKE